MIELVTVDIDERVLVLGLGNPRTDRYVLRSLHIQRDAVDGLQRLLKPLDDLIGRGRPLSERLQRNEYTTVILGHGRPARSDIGVGRGDRRILRYHRQNRPHAVLHRLRRDVLRALGDALDQASVFLWEKAFWDRYEQYAGQGDGRDHDHQGDEAMAQCHHQPTVVNGGQPIKEALERARDQARSRSALRRQEAGAHHRGQTQRDNDRDEDRHHDGDGELAEQQADDTAHQKQRYEHRSQRDRDRHDRKTDLAGALQSSLHRGLPLLDVSHDVFDHDDRIVDDKADGDRQRHQREIVEAVADHIHDHEGADQRHRHRYRRDQSPPKFAQEEENDPDDQPDRQQQRMLDIGDAGTDRLRAVRHDMDLERRRQRGFELR